MAGKDRSSDELVERERLVLQHIIQNFVLTANPVGSRTISRHTDIGLSPATVRNIMSDLEEQGYITHPHTSAGRTPTDKGYRYYVNSLMHVESLSGEEKDIISSSIESSPYSETDGIFKEATSLLSRISRQIAVVVTPQFQDGVLQHIELLSVSSNKVMVVLSIASGFVKTMMFELATVVKPTYLERLSAMVNERLSGLTLRQIRETCAERFRDTADEESGLVRLFVVASEKLFSPKIGLENVLIDGIHEAVQQPEFMNPSNLLSIIELVEDKKIIVHILENRDRKDSISISIGSELSDEKLQDFSLITSIYAYGSVQGTIGLVGPKRMNYSKLVPIVEYVSKLISDKYSS